MEHKNISTATNLSLALYDNAKELHVVGTLAESLYHGCKSIKRLIIALFFLVIMLIAAIPMTALMLPGIIIVTVLMALFSLPLVYLSLADVSPRVVNRVRRRYDLAYYDANEQVLHLVNRGLAFESKSQMFARRRPTPMPFLKN